MWKYTCTSLSTLILLMSVEVNSLSSLSQATESSVRAETFRRSSRPATEKPRISTKFIFRRDLKGFQITHPRPGAVRNSSKQPVISILTIPQSLLSSADLQNKAQAWFFNSSRFSSKVGTVNYVLQDKSMVTTGCTLV